MADNSKVRTLDDYIDFGYNEDFSITKCITLQRFDNIIIPDDIVYDKYRNLLNQNLAAIELSMEEQKKYLYRPDRFAMDVYGNPALSHLICYLNRCSEYEFKPETVIFLEPNALADVLKLILVHESSNISKKNKKALG